MLLCAAVPSCGGCAGGGCAGGGCCAAVGSRGGSRDGNRGGSSDGNSGSGDGNDRQFNLELTAINQGLLDLSDEQTEDGNPVISNTNGFILSVVTDEKNPVGTLNRRFAVAKDGRGITLLKGTPSFSASDQILIDELVFYIQQNDLKAN